MPVYYSNVKNLDKLQVFKNEYPDIFGESTYFKISEFPEVLSYGKHTFFLAIKVPKNNKLVYCQWQKLISNLVNIISMLSMKCHYYDLAKQDTSNVRDCTLYMKMMV